MPKIGSAPSARIFSRGILEPSRARGSFLQRNWEKFHATFLAERRRILGQLAMICHDGTGPPNATLELVRGGWHPKSCDGVAHLPPHAFQEREMSGKIVALSFRESKISSRSEQATLRLGRHVFIGRALLACMACATHLGAPVAAQSPAGDIDQLDKAATEDGAESAPAEAQSAPAEVAAEREYMPEEQARFAEATAKIVELCGQDRYAEAIPLAEEVVAIARRVHGAEHATTASMLDSLGFVLEGAGARKGVRNLFIDESCFFAKS
jgi:hypothetical protein